MKVRVYAGMITALITVGVLLFLSSCAVEEAGGPAPAIAPPPPTMFAEGRPAFHPGLPASYWIWHDRMGWHLRVTTGGLRHQFMGTVEAGRGGFIQSFHPTSLEARDRIRVEGDRLIRFSFWTHGDVDGFDWQSPSGCNIFNLAIDNAPHPERVFVGAFSDHPPAVVFEACR